MPTRATYTGRLADATAPAVRDAAKVNEETAKRIEAGAKFLAPRGTHRRPLRSKIRAVPGIGDDWLVIVPVWYAHFPEFGTVHHAARPYLTPAAEAQRVPHRQAVKDLYS